MTPFEPVLKARKLARGGKQLVREVGDEGMGWVLTYFSTVLGTTSANSSKMTLPRGCPSTWKSRKVRGLTIRVDQDERVDDGSDVDGFCQEWELYGTRSSLAV